MLFRSEISKHRERESKSKKKKQNCLHQSEVDRRTDTILITLVVLKSQRVPIALGEWVINVKERV